MEGCGRDGEEGKPYFSFAAAGWLKVWYYGVGKCFQHRLDLTRFRFCGASAGALVAAGLVLGVDFDAIAELSFRCSEDCRSSLTGPFRLREYLLQCLELSVGPDAHLQANGRLYVAVTEIPSMRAHLVSRFSSRDELIFYLLASCLIPILAGLPIPWHPEGNSTRPSAASSSPWHPLRWLIDGGFRQMLPVFPDADTYSCSAVGPAHLTPHRRIPSRYCVYPPAEDQFRAIYQQGFDDAARWLFSSSMPSIDGAIPLLASSSSSRYPRRRRNHEVHNPLRPDFARPKLVPSLKSQSEALIDFHPRPPIKLVPFSTPKSNPDSSSNSTATASNLTATRPFITPKKSFLFYLQQVCFTAVDLLLLLFSSLFLAPFVWYSHAVESYLTFLKNVLLALLSSLLSFLTRGRIPKSPSSVTDSWRQFRAAVFSPSSKDLNGSIGGAESSSEDAAPFHWALRYLPVSSYVIARRSSKHLEQSRIYRLVRQTIFPI